MHLFVVTSVIYTYQASVFSPMKRLEQLINTFDSIYSKMQGQQIYIVLIEGSMLSRGEIKVLSKYVNYIHFTNVLNFPKSMGEASLLKSYFTSNHFQQLKPNLQTISKISGRYYLTEEFNFNRYPLESSVIKTYDDVYDTRYYRFNASNADFFISKLDDVMKTLDREDIEHSFYRNQIFPKHTLIHPNTLGVEGQIAPSGAVQKD